jgi:hypothetical protein
VSCVQTLEVGVEVNPGLNAATGAAPEAETVFVGATNDGYASFCADNFNTDGGACPVTWMTVSGSNVTPGVAVSPVSVLGAGASEQSEFGVWIEAPHGTSPNWEVFDAIDATVSTSTSTWFEMGFFVASDYSAPMSTGATEYQVGGEVSDSTGGCVVPMGTGANPRAGYGQAAYHRDYVAVDTAGDSLSAFTTPTTTVPNVYTVDTSVAAGSGWPTGTFGNYFYNGVASLAFGPGIGNTGLYYSPAGDGVSWDNGSDTATCPLLANQLLGIPMSGVSENPSSRVTHAVQCGSPVNGWIEGTQTVQNASSSSCRVLALSDTDDRGYSGPLDPGTNGDWDPGYYKAECAQDEYVLGLALNSSGWVDGILCCNGGMLHDSCDAQVFSNSNSKAYSLPDWDYGYYKGQCPPSQYVAGISTPAFSQQATGTPHAILCCE